MMTKIIMLIILGLFISSSADEIKTIKRYKIKVFKGSWNIWSGEKDCYLIKNAEGEVIKFGGVDKKDYRIELRMVKDD